MLSLVGGLLRRPLAGNSQRTRPSSATDKPSTDLLFPTRGGCLAFNDAQHFFLPQDQILFVVHLAEEDAIARLHIQRHNFPGLIFLATADGDYFAFLRFLFGGLKFIFTLFSRTSYKPCWGRHRAATSPLIL